jgi:hypothetical protein
MDLTIGDTNPGCRVIVERQAASRLPVPATIADPGTREAEHAPV